MRNISVCGYCILYINIFCALAKRNAFDSRYVYDFEYTINTIQKQWIMTLLTDFIWHVLHGCYWKLFATTRRNLCVRYIISTLIICQHRTFCYDLLNTCSICIKHLYLYKHLFTCKVTFVILHKNGHTIALI